jgi:hypothetical protein
MRVRSRSGDAARSASSSTQGFEEATKLARDGRHGDDATASARGPAGHDRPQGGAGPRRRGARASGESTHGQPCAGKPGPTCIREVARAPRRQKPQESTPVSRRRELIESFTPPRITGRHLRGSLLKRGSPEGTPRSREAGLPPTRRYASNRSRPAGRCADEAERPRGRIGFTWWRGVAPLVIAVLARGGRNGPLGHARVRGSVGVNALEGQSPGEHRPRCLRESGAPWKRTRGGRKASKQTKSPERGESGARGPGHRGSRVRPVRESARSRMRRERKRAGLNGGNGVRAPVGIQATALARGRR